MATKDQKDLNVQEAVVQLMDSVGLFGALHGDTNARRRESFNEDYHSICAPKNPVTDWLFGDNITEQLKFIGETNKVS